ncbi:diacylglycerol/lipid kinase family protein [Aporhodopirellula aestuarii]|uniref:Lipid kinase n=1 Tax=Aporhodopirellula aestuarii TaxID=2950107 RepID=A0ABT0U0F7_9BACT|nr:diacylglycerol kinase family protein [Aporhodopirellula aestuarii]MCM2370311.1 lipid kinase [Aporhodopirellula aestuarii]
MNAPVAILANPNASGWGMQRTDLERLARASGDQLIKLDSEGRWLMRLSSLDTPRLCIYGGDGTLSSVIAQLEREDLLGRFELGLIPGGTGNDFARSIGLHGLSLAEAYRYATSADAVPVDLIDVLNGTSRLIVNAATAGFGGLVSGDVTEADKRRWGAMAYWVAAFTHLTSLPQYSIELNLDDGRGGNFDVFGLAITSGRYVGGGFPVSPDAIVNDGLLNVTVIPVMPVGELLAAGVDFTLNRNSEPRRIVTFKTRSVHVTATPRLPYSLDGESQQSEHAEFAIRPAAVNVTCHPQATGVWKSRKRHAVT